jgi:hypothetical protein
MVLRRLFWSLVLVFAFAQVVVAADHAVSGSRLTIKSVANGKSKVVFVSRDPNLVLPALDGSDDPRNATAYDGTSFEIFFADGDRRS